MRNIKWKKDNPTYLIQNPHNISISLITNEELYYSNVTCKDYYQELMAYLLENKFGDKSQYGFLINTKYYEQFQNQEYYEFAFWSNTLGIQNKDFDNVNNWINTLIEKFPYFENKISIEKAVRSNDKPIIILKLASDIIKVYYRLSFVLGAIRNVLYIPINKNNPKNWFDFDLLKIADQYSHLYNCSELDISDFHNKSGIHSFIEKLIVTNSLFRVAVYGTLKKDLRNNFLLNDATFLYKAHKPIAHNNKFAQIYQTGFNFPGIKFTRKTPVSIEYEVYLVNADQLKRLDQLEGYYKNNIENSLYVRLEIRLDYQPTNIYVYNKNLKGKRIVAGGIFK